MFGLIVRDYAYFVCFSVHSTQHTAHEKEHQHKNVKLLNHLCTLHLLHRKYDCQQRINHEPIDVVSFKIVYKNVRRAFFAELFNMTPVQIREGGWSAISRMKRRRPCSPCSLSAHCVSIPSHLLRFTLFTFETRLLPP